MIVFFCSVGISIFAFKKNYDSVKIIPYNTYGVVLGTSKYSNRDKKINFYFKSRIEAVEMLFKSKKIRYIIVSGDNRNKNYNEPEMMKEELIKRGIPYNFIYEDLYGINTINSIMMIYKNFHQKKFTIISQKFHNERAIFIGNCIGLDITGFNALGTSFNIKMYLREILARIKVFWDVIYFYWFY
ncbi:SanA/YdcF family protein [Blattabacterium cuenoti]|uniref:SanA/YdcF family protein n=1 Tax=Blattabacterium cuenoti TaxID=1653831 RepID=UPI00163BCFCB|nr:ElyC/SanA/YdcF family protein [Blattabacterium cuenoti]